MSQSTEPSQSPIHHDAGIHRFATTIDGTKAYLDYRMEGGMRMVITHTWVPPEIGGRGVAGRLVRAAFDFAREAGLKVVPACSYAESWAGRHAEYADILA